MALLKEVSVGEHWAYRISDADRLKEVVVLSINQSSPARVVIAHAGDPESLVDSVPPSRLKVRWSEREHFLQREAEWRTISSQPDSDEFDAVGVVIREFLRPAASIGRGKLLAGTIAIHDPEVVDLTIGGGLSELLRDCGRVVHEGATYYPWVVAVAIAQQTCRAMPETVMSYVHAEELRERLDGLGAEAGFPGNMPGVAPIWPLWNLLRDWCGQGALSADVLVRVRNESAELAAVLAEAVALIANELSEVSAQGLFARAYPGATDDDWRAYLDKARRLTS